MPYLKVKIQDIATLLKAADENAQEACQEAFWMLRAITGKDQAHLMRSDEIDLERDQHTTLQDWIRQRVEEKKPLQYILGTVDFCGLSINVRPPILIPRPETEYWTDWLIQLVKQAQASPLKILDLCSGSGCIALALAHHLPHATIVGLDYNPEAVALAWENTKKNHILNVEFRHSDLFGSLKKDEKFDLIVSNPPYIPHSEWLELDQTVRLWEDSQALIAKNNGLAFYEAISAQAQAHLSGKYKNIPALVFEIGATQADDVRAILTNNRFSHNTVHKDLAGKNRFIASYL